MPPMAEMYTHEDVWDLYRKHGTVEAVADALGVPRHEVSPIIDEMPLRQVYRHKGSAPTVYTDKELLAILKEAGKVCGEPLTLPAYHAVAPEHGWPAALTITQRFGTWEKACKLAGVKVNKATGPRKGSITVDKCLVALRLCRADFAREAVAHNKAVRKLRKKTKLTSDEKKILAVGEVAEDIEPSYERYVKWARANGQPSGPTVRSKVGPWREALKLAYGED